MTATAVNGDVGSLLRTWRERRRLSQLELAHRAQVSTRHLSFVETGRSRPTPEMIDKIAETLEVPLRDRNDLLLAGGYAPRYRSRAVEDADLAVVMAGLRRLLDAHAPSPALLLDSYWDVIDANAGVDLLLAGCAPELLEPPINAVRVTLHPGGLAPRIRNLDAWAAQLVGQVRARAERTADPRLLALADEAAHYVDPPARRPPPSGPVLAMELAHGAHTLRLFGLGARLETATDVTLDGLHLELFLPADATTQAVLAEAQG